MATTAAPQTSRRNTFVTTRRAQQEDGGRRRVLRSVNPYNGEVLRTYPEMQGEEVDQAIAKAHEFFRTWRGTFFSDRAPLLRLAAEICRERKETLARLMALEMGKRVVEGRKEVELCAKIFEYYATHGETLLQPQIIPSPEGNGTLLNEPLGVIFGVEPWNYPCYQIVRCAAPNLMAGNVVVMKHASSVPQCAEALELLFHDAGFRNGAYTNLAISSQLANRVIDDDRVQGVSFTGSDAAGAQVAERAGKNAKKSILELGGSDPFVVLEDADLEMAVACAVEGKMTNMGQSCVAAKRFILLKKISDEFLERFTEALGSLKMGDPLEESTGVAPLSSKEAAESLEAQVKASVAGGAQVILGGSRPDRNSAFFEPTILTNVQKGTPAYDEELFGPVAAVMVVPDEAAAITVANDTKYGLGGSVHSRDEAHARVVASQIDAGMVYINHPAWIYEDMPFGGIRKSGYGRECGSLGIQEFVNKKLLRAIR